VLKIWCQRCFEKTKTSALNGGGNIWLDTDTQGNPAKYIERDTDVPQLPDEGSLHYGRSEHPFQKAGIKTARFSPRCTDSLDGEASKLLREVLGLKFGEVTSSS
jgi:hypothetical protein